MTPTHHNWDAIVVGSGQAGTPLARKLAKAGLNTVIFEKEHVGGTCVNEGCTPTKTMIADARIAQTVRTAGDRGIHTEGLTIDLAAIIARKNQVVDSARTSNEKGLVMPNLTLIRENAVFTGEKTLSAGGATHTADRIFINTGCSPVIPALDGLKDIPYLTSKTILDIPVVPRHLIVLGGGYIALEMGQLFRRLGSEVTIIERGAALMAREDQDIRDAMRDILEGEGIRILLGTSVERVWSGAGVADTAAVTLETSAGPVSGSHLLVATGRAAGTAALGVDKAGIAVDAHGFIKVNEYLETSVPGVYALGDVKGGPAFTHISYNDYVIIAANILQGRRLSTTDRQVPYTVFTDPQLGRIGLTETEARAQGRPIQVATLPMTHVARAIETGDTRGLMKAVVDTETRQILGAAILGTEGGEIMTILQMAMTGTVTYDHLRDMVFAHPLYAESINNLFLTLEH
ncbi:MAG TPA: mercuric reductase [Dinghuibacter sp.]|uniref:mercuric reductase n=1 Tax=Dinghuibacter sp. TaxID=2024697 RepID=UPI002C9D56CC|nr:mercuric reductase [Dinghuibacter sp.]HTJ14235.1 mercuric reductase [Dinghuibacter sp.]